MRPCTPTPIVRILGTSTWENLGLVAYNTVVRALPESACFCNPLVLLALPLGPVKKAVKPRLFALELIQVLC
jgi:hypothetical protein